MKIVFEDNIIVDPSTNSATPLPNMTITIGYKDMPAVAPIDMRGEVDLCTLPVGTFIVTVGPTKDVTHEDHQYMKCKRSWRGSDESTWDDHSLAEELTEQTLAGRRTIIRDIPNYPIY